MRAVFDEHAEAAPLLDQSLVDQFLISLQDGEGIDSIFRGDVSHGRQGIAFFEHVVEYHMDDMVAKLSINRLIIIPFTIHPVLQTPLLTRLRARPSLDCSLCLIW